MHFVLLGASRGCGLETAIQILRVHPSASLTLLLRKPEEVIPVLTGRGIPAIDIGEEQGKKVRLVQGDALKMEDVEKLFMVPVDGILFSIGGRPDFSNPLHPTLTPASICTRSISVLLPILKTYTTSHPTPHLIIISSNGLGRDGYSTLPLYWKPIYGWLLHEPHADKEIMEWLLFNASGVTHPDTYVEEFARKEASEEAKEVKNAIGGGWLKKFTIVRPAWLVDGEAKGVYRVGEVVKGGSTIRRADVGHFIAEKVVGKEEWVGKAVTVAY
ncbi:hypothetical protein HDV00_012336 [Rhizophlyctis rosea]|nr:hypothetical protein HDV00_012336 [Rhizophlyctis rosea]